MSDPSVATVSADIGPGLAVSTSRLTGVREAHFNFIDQTLQVVCEQGRPIYDIKDQATLTLTVSGVTYTLTIS